MTVLAPYVAVLVLSLLLSGMLLVVPVLVASMMGRQVSAATVARLMSWGAVFIVAAAYVTRLAA